MKRLFRNRQGLGRNSLVGCEATSQYLTLTQVVPGRRPDVRALHRVPNPGLAPQALRSMAIELGLQHADWTWVLPHEHYQLMLVDVPEVPPEEIKSALHWRVKDLIAFPLEEAAIDTMLLPPEAFRGRSRMAFSVVARRDLTEPVAQAFGEAGLKLNAIDVADTALRTLAGLSAQTPSVALMKVGPKESVLNATYNGELCLNRVISLGAQDLSPESMTAQGEQGLSLQDQNDMQLEALGLELQRSFDYFDNQLGLGAIHELRILCAETLAPEVYHFLNERFDCQCSALSFNDHMTFPPHTDHETLVRHAVSLGAAAQWLHEERP